MQRLQKKRKSEQQRKSGNFYVINPEIRQFDTLTTEHENLRAKIETMEEALLKKDRKIAIQKKEIDSLKLQLKTVQLAMPQNVQASAFVLEASEKARIQAEKDVEKKQTKLRQVEQRMSELVQISQTNSMKAHKKVQDLLEQIKSYTEFVMPFNLTALDLQIVERNEISDQLLDFVVDELC